VRGGPTFHTFQNDGWVAFDRAVKLVEECGCVAADRAAGGERFAIQIHAEVCERDSAPSRKLFSVLRFGCP